MAKMNERIRELISYRHGRGRGSIKSFAQRLEISGNVVSHWLNGRTEPPIEMRVSICRLYNISREWLDTGQGDMLAVPRTETAAGSTQIWQGDTNHAESAETILGLKNELYVRTAKTQIFCAGSRSNSLKT